jgi:hypothetical protein
MNTAIISPYNEKSISILLSKEATGISDLDLSLAHRMLLLPWTQRICHQSRAEVLRFAELTIDGSRPGAGVGK